MQIGKPNRRLIPLAFAIVLVAATLTGRVLGQSIQLPVKGPFPDIADSVHVHYERLRQQFGMNKTMPPGLEKQIIYALSYFPELAQTKIHFKMKKSTGGIIATQPTIGSIFKHSTKRKYVVIINDSTEGRKTPLFANGDINGQVGILGHELCHILYFRESTGLGLIGLGIAHVSKSYMDRFEHNTDSVDIERGLGYQLIAWNEYLHKGFRAMRARDSTSGQKFVPGKRYMSIEEIQAAMAKKQR